MTKKILQDEESFKKDALSKMSLSDLSKKYGIKECTVAVWKKKLNVITVPHNIPLPNKDVFAEELKKYTNVQLAEKYHVGLKLISKWRVKLGLANIWPNQMISSEILKKDCERLDTQDLIKEYGVSKSTINLWKQLYGLSSGKKENRKIRVEIRDNGCWFCISHKLGDKGYAQCKGEKLVVKRLWEEKYKKEWPLGLICIHSCDNRWCVNPEHVMPGTKKENSEGMAERHRSPWGWRCGARKLTPEQAKEIYGLKGTISLRKAAKKFNVSSATIFNIWKGNTWWRDIDGIPNFNKKIGDVKVGEELHRDVIGSPPEQKIGGE
jgi:uncharacterized protein YjcR